MTEIKCKICDDIGLLDENNENAPGKIFFGVMSAGTITNNKEIYDMTNLKSFLGIWNHREQKANWICLSCLCEKLTIEEDRKPRGGMF